MEEKEPLMFPFGIVAVENPPGKLDFKVKIINKGIQDEVVIIKMRTWIKQAEEIYSEKFKNDFSL